MFHALVRIAPRLPGRRSRRAGRLCLVLALGLSLGAPARGQEGVRLAEGSDPSADLRGKTVVYQNNGSLMSRDVKRGITTAVATGVDEARISAKGTAVAFASDADPLGTNGDRNFEIFLHDSKRAVTTQITVSSDTFDCCWSPSVDKKGSRVAFLSHADFVGLNADESDELFIWDGKAGTITQATVTSDSFTNEDAVIDSKGKYVYFSSDANLVGLNGDQNREIFRYDVDAGVIEQLTVTTDGDSANPVPNKNGKFIAFETDSTDLLGANADGMDEIVRLDVKKGTILRLTDYPFASGDPAISGNGKTVAFESRGDPFGTNADGSRELFVVLIKKKALETSQLTSGAAAEASGQASLDNGGKRIIFESDASLTGEGSGTDYVFQFATR